MEHRIYKPLHEYSEGEAMQILERGNEDELISLPFSVGQYCVDWKKAQDICIRLMGHRNPLIRANAAMGLAYTARAKGRLEKHTVKPLLLRELRGNTEYQWRIADAIEEINLSLGWHLAEKALAKINSNDPK